MKKLKVLILNYEYPPIGGGAATATRNLLRQYAKRDDIEIDLITSSVDKYREEFLSDNVHIYFLNIMKTGSLHAQSNFNLVTYSVLAILKAKKLIKEKNYDLVHAFFGIPCGYVAMKLGKKYIVSLRGSDVPFYSRKYYLMDKFIFQYLSKTIWKNAEYVIANSQGLRDLAHRTIPDQKIEVIYNGAEWVEELERGRDEKFIVISTSRLMERKGLDYLIKGFVKFANGKDDTELRFYGGGDQMEKLQNLTRELNAEDKVIFFGDKPREFVYKEMVGASAFGLPSKNEGMSNSLLEAMVRGIPVITTDVGGTKELVNEENGFIVDQENSDQIADALEKLYRDRELVERMGKAGRERVRSLNLENIAEQYIKLYKKVADDN